MTVQLVLPAGGGALRMGQLPKELLPLGVRRSGDSVVPAPAIALSLQLGIRSGAQSALIVTSSEKASLLMSVVDALDLPIAISYVHQKEPCGMAPAVLAAAALLRDEDIALMLMPDTAMSPIDPVLEAVDAVRDGAIAACATLYEVEKPEHFGVARFDASGRVLGFIDKPERPPSKWVWTAVCFRRPFLSYLEKSIGEGSAGDFTRALDLAAAAGSLVTRRAESGTYWDIGTHAGYQAALAAFGSQDILEALSGSS